MKSGWHTCPECWILSGVVPRLFLVSLHGGSRNEDEVFEMMKQNGFVIFQESCWWYRYEVWWYGWWYLARTWFREMDTFIL